MRLTLLTTSSNEIDAEAAVTLRIVTPNTRDAFLDLTSATAEGKGMTVTGVTLAGRDIPIEHRANRLRLPLPADVTAGQDITFVIRYHGAPADGLRSIPTSGCSPSSARSRRPPLDPSGLPSPAACAGTR